MEKLFRKRHTKTNLPFIRRGGAAPLISEYDKWMKEHPES
jgi:hypothetical protein